MHSDLIKIIEKLNPWLNSNNDITPNYAEYADYTDNVKPGGASEQISTSVFTKIYTEISTPKYIARKQTEKLLLPDWDKMWLVLVGPRQAGKTTLGKHIAQQLIQRKRFSNLLYLTCDALLIRQWLTSPLFIDEAIRQFNLQKFILFIDEVQRLENPGLLLKEIVDLKLPIKLIASGSSQLEIKSKVQEHLTGRHLEGLILPLSIAEQGELTDNNLIYGCYPEIVNSLQKELLLKQLYADYINKDIIEILRIGKADVMQKLITLLANSAGQLVNYHQLATDCKVTINTIQHYCAILEKTYVIQCVKPFVGNKRKEIVANPIYYFIDNGFRNQALRRFAPLEQREGTDLGLLIENAVFQEIYKFRAQNFLDFDIFFWRTQSKAEVDFIIYKNIDTFIPVEVKYRNLAKPTVPRGFRSFIEAYKPKIGIIITKNLSAEVTIDGCEVQFMPFDKLRKFFQLLEQQLISL